MEAIGIIAQVLAALGILNVWILRFNKATEFRGGKAQNMKEEFQVYGFPELAVYVVGAIKILLAVGLLLGIWIDKLVIPASVALASLMVGAAFMHFRAGDEFKRYVPALLILIFSTIAAIAASVN